MNNTNSIYDENTRKLAQWLQDILYIAPTASTDASIRPPKSSPTGERDIQLELLLQDSSYHKEYYQQIPDFVLALLNNNPQAPIHYAPLLYHLAGCPICHQSYLEIYDAMHVALYPHEPRPILGQGTRTLDATPQRMLAHLCQAWITQAEAILREARQNKTDGESAARILLQSAISMSARIKQDAVRQQARHDLVRVATLFDAAKDSQTNPAEHSFTPVLTGARGVVRRAEKTATGFQTKEENSNFLAIVLHSQGIEGTVLQRGQTLELHMQSLDASLRGHFITTSIVLGSLIEPIRWLGGNPRAIRSTTPVDTTGTLVMPLGETDLRLNVPEERNLLETTFLLLEIRIAD